MTADEFIEYIEKRIYPFTCSETGRAYFSDLFRRYPESFLLECVDIGIKQYFKYDDGKLTKKSVCQFISKLDGIAHNRSLNPINQEILHIKNIGNKKYIYWSNSKADDILTRYMSTLKKKEYSDEQILNDLKNNVRKICNSSRNWTQWSDTMEQWIIDIENEDLEDDSTIIESGTILPTQLFENVSHNIQLICKQINASYENNLYDCTAVMMRRLLEELLVLAYQHHGIESEITENDGCYYTLDKIIKNIITNSTLSLSANTKQDVSLFNDIGNFSAHKIWYNATKQDIEPHILKYRIIIEELMYKSGVK